MKRNQNERYGPRYVHPDLESLLQRLPPGEAEHLREVWHLAGDEDFTPSPSPEEVEGALRGFMAGREAIEPAPPRDTTTPPTSRRARRPDRRTRGAAVGRRRGWVGWFGWAALAGVLLVVGLGVLWWTRPVTQFAHPGERLAFTLPDGSLVQLNSGSRLEYARRFGDVRHVRLYGEAFFDVSENVRPFVVETFNAEIRVLGTRFGVRAWPGGLEDGTTVALEAGRVRLAPAGRPERAVEIGPGETLRVTAGAAGPTLHDLADVTVDDATAWRHGDLVFKDQRLGVILDDVERRFAVEIRVQPAGLRQKRFGLALRQPASAEAVVRDLALALGLVYRETSTGFELFEDSVTPVQPPRTS